MYEGETLHSSRTTTTETTKRVEDDPRIDRFPYPLFLFYKEKDKKRTERRRRKLASFVWAPRHSISERKRERETASEWVKAKRILPHTSRSIPQKPERKLFRPCSAISASGTKKSRDNKGNTGGQEQEERERIGGDKRVEGGIKGRREWNKRIPLAG